MRERKSLKVITRAALMLCAAFALLVFSPIVSKAEGNPGFYSKESTLLLYKGSGANYYSLSNIKDGDKISASSSNKDIATARVQKYTAAGRSFQSVVITPKKVGTTTVTCTVKRGGKSFKSTMKVTVIKYKNPLKSFKYAGTEYAKQLNERPSYYIKKMKKEGKVSVTANSEWKIVQIFTYSNKTGKGKDWKNNKNVSTKGMTQLSVRVQNKKNKNLYITVHLSFGQ